MKKIIKKINTHISNYQTIYLFLVIVFLVGTISGTLFLNKISDTNKDIILTNLTNFFSNVEEGNVTNSREIFTNSIIFNFSYIFIIWLLGISIIGIPIVVFMVFALCFF